MEDAAREWAGQVVAAIRAHQRDIRIGEMKLSQVRRPLSDVVARLCLGRKFDEVPAKAAVNHEHWWRPAVRS